MAARWAVIACVVAGSAALPEKAVPFSTAVGLAGCDTCCEYIHFTNTTWQEVPDKCECAQQIREEGLDDSVIPYMVLHTCNLDCVPWFSYGIATFWLLFLFGIVASTADGYMVPNLEHLSSTLHLSPNVAGVTILAFGNGAPDFFTSLAAFKSSTNVNIGMGSVLGAGIFITSLVFGSVAMVRPFKTVRRPVLRDISFYLLAATILLYVCIDGRVTKYEALVLVSLYVVYVSLVVFGHIVYQRVLKERNAQPAMQGTRRALVFESGPASARESGAAEADDHDGSAAVVQAMLRYRRGADKLKGEGPAQGFARDSWSFPARAEEAPRRDALGVIE